MARPKRDKRLKPVYQLDPEGNILHEFPSVSKAAEHHGATTAHIGDVCQGRKPSAAGFRWCYKNKYKYLKKKWETTAGRNRSGVWQKDVITGQRITSFDTMKAACEALAHGATPAQLANIRRGIIIACQNPGRTAKGYQWEYKTKGE
jgi:hypothetical protein